MLGVLNLLNKFLLHRKFFVEEVVHVASMGNRRQRWRCYGARLFPGFEVHGRCISFRNCSELMKREKKVLWGQLNLLGRVPPTIGFEDWTEQLKTCSGRTRWTAVEGDSAATSGNLRRLWPRSRRYTAVIGNKFVVYNVHSFSCLQIIKEREARIETL